MKLKELRSQLSSFKLKLKELRYQYNFGTIALTVKFASCQSVPEPEISNFSSQNDILSIALYYLDDILSISIYHPINSRSQLPAFSDLFLRIFLEKRQRK